MASDVGASCSWNNANFNSWWVYAPWENPGFIESKGDGFEKRVETFFKTQEIFGSSSGNISLFHWEEKGGTAQSHLQVYKHSL